MVKTPSSCEDSFFIWSAKTCASSMIENSASALQYPQQITAIIATTLHQIAMKSRWSPKWLFRKSVQVVNLTSRGLYTSRLAMMARVGLEKWKSWLEIRSFAAMVRKQLQGKVLFNFLSKYTSSSMSTFSERRSAQNIFRRNPLRKTDPLVNELKYFFHRCRGSADR